MVGRRSSPARDRQSAARPLVGRAQACRICQTGLQKCSVTAFKALPSTPVLRYDPAILPQVPSHVAQVLLMYPFAQPLVPIDLTMAPNLVVRSL